MGARALIPFVQAHGFDWPAGSEGYCQRYVKHSSDMEKALDHCRLKKVAVQAGGHCGVWPLWLTNHGFETVYTFEPNPANFFCLVRNISAHDMDERIFPARGMLGNNCPPLSMSVSKKNIGGHKGKPDPGDIPVYTIDNLNLPICDLIVLDVEGMEYPALMGANETIQRCQPVIMLEDKEHGDRYGWGARDKVSAWMAMRKYKIVGRIAEDVIWKSASRLG